MANISQIKIFKHIVTAAEEAAFFVAIPILWDSPFNDTNYAIGWDFTPATVGIGASGTLSFEQGMIDVTPRGFTACINTPSAGPLTIRAIASHK